jgi:hypothetical protein
MANLAAGRNLTHKKTVSSLEETSLADDQRSAGRRR